MYRLGTGRLSFVCFFEADRMTLVPFVTNLVVNTKWRLGTTFRTYRIFARFLCRQGLDGIRNYRSHFMSGSVMYIRHLTLQRRLTHVASPYCNWQLILSQEETIIIIIIELLSLWILIITRRARGIARLPVPQPASHTEVPSKLLPKSPSTLSTVWACPVRISNCTCRKNSKMYVMLDPCST